MPTFIPTLLVAGLILASPVFADPPLAEKYGCDSCHRFSSDALKESKSAPDLFYAGDKFQKSWLEKFLRNPVVIRKAGISTDPGFLLGTPTLARPHPALPGDEAVNKMTGFLMSLTLSDLPPNPVNDTPLTKGEKARTKILFERKFGCIACHEGINLAGQPRGGISGPSLANAGNRLTADWVSHWLTTPDKFLSKSRMPVYKLDEESTIKLTKYIMTLKIGDWK